MRRLVWLVWSCCAACRFSAAVATDADPGGDDGDASGSDSSVDAPPDAVVTPSALCAGTPRLDEQFQGTTECSPWGAIFMTSTLVDQGSGRLHIVPAATNASGGCTEPSLGAWGGNGVIVEVPKVLTGATNFTVFQLLGLDRSMGVVNGGLVYSTGEGTVTFKLGVYVAALMRWWRMRPTAGAVVAEYSADAITWTTFHSEPTTLADMRVNLIAGTSTGLPVGSADFTRFVICQ